MHSEIKITRPLATHILTLAQQSANEEICGLISADKNGNPSTVHPVNNVSPSPASHFEMDPQGQIDALKTMRTKQEKLFAIYHSHPSTHASPSDRDLANIGYPGVYQLIVSLNTKGVLEMRAYQLNAKGLSEVQLSV